MKLYLNPMSSHARKVTILAHEAGLIDRIETRDSRGTPTHPNIELNKDNPLGKIPTLVTEDGQALYDSTVICLYLDDRHSGRKMVPASAMERITALRRNALADGFTDAAVAVMYETSYRPNAWDKMIEGQKAKVELALDVLEKEASSLNDQPDLGGISIAAALGYLDFRFAQDRWRDKRPTLAAWFDKFARRPSMQATGHHD